MKGYLSLILHTHLPYVRHLEDPNALEQRWLFEAITESYIPLLNVFDGLARDKVSFRITMSLTPPLLEMLSDEVMQARYLHHLDRTVELAEKEVSRLQHEADFKRVAEMYLWKLKEARYVVLEKYGGNLINGFRRLAQDGYLELITSAATHAYLPLAGSREAVEAQVGLGVDAFQRHLGWKPQGIWLPECGYSALVDEVVAEAGIKFVVVDSHALLHADPAPDSAVYAPISTTNGLLAFARDPESAKQVWSGKEGYPGDFDYREYYRDIGWDLDYEYIQPYIHPEGIRLNTGLKYYRVTGPGDHREPYVPEWAEARAAEHAGHFLGERSKQVTELAERYSRPPIILSPYDTELFGHWWYEGPAFLNYLVRKIHFDQDVVELISPADYPQPPAVEKADVPECSWGNEGYNGVWLNERNAWVYRHLHAAEERMTALAEARQDPDDLEKRALTQAGRELLLAQSSDWAFILNSGTATEYANRRLNEHLGWFFSLASQIEQGEVDEGTVAQLEQHHSIFPYLDYKRFASERVTKLLPASVPGQARIMLLSWEFPPVTVGGLGRHVFELSRALVKQGAEVHVVTLGAASEPTMEVVDGVWVHRTASHKMPGDSFLDWVFQLNLQLYELARQVFLRNPFDVVHGHDWLVGEACRIIAKRYQVPLLATIHATEHGRNNGLHNETQRSIDRLEREFMDVADKVIVCSQAMRRELLDVFGQPEGKVMVIPNGIDVESLTPMQGPSPIPLPEHGKVVAFLGRLVREKGVELLVDAAGEISKYRSDIHFVIAGKGPCLEQLEQKVDELGLGDMVSFPGFVNDRGRNALLERSSVAVFPSLYEPFGIVALEAMGAGRPVIVSDTGGLAEIVEHGVDGWKVYPGDLHGLVHTIQQVIDDPNAWRVAERAKQKTIEVYSWHPIAERTMETYKRMAAEYKQMAVVG